MAMRQQLNGYSAGLRVTSSILLLVFALGFGVECWFKREFQVPWGLALVLACLLRFIWLVFNAGARFFEVGCYYEEEMKAWKRIAEDERKRGKAPVAWRIGRLGCDLYGLFIQEPGGSRRRDV